MRKILFVDDEVRVLEGLRRMLRGLRHEWDMEFVESGPDALHRLEVSPYDVIVSDMRMPCMDGSELLHEVLDRHPATVRMILSGQCEREVVLKCVGPTHQFLTKPCDSELLKGTVARACRLRDHLPHDWIKRIVSSVQSLPSWPSNYSEFAKQLDAPAPSIQRIGEVVCHDPGMAAKIVQLVSSGFFGSPQRLADPARAVGLLGLDTLAAVAEVPGVFFPLGPENSQELFFAALNTHSKAVAEAARGIAESETDDDTLIGDAYLSGLLHDIGILVLAKDSPEHYAETVALARMNEITLKQAEKMTFDTTRDDVGAYLMGLWGLPDPVVRAIAYHLSPSLAPDRTFGPLAAVHVANAVIEQDSADTPGAPTSVDMQYLGQIGCADRLDSWRETCMTRKSEGVLQ